jgi:tRNA threonylcarbamoyladenosine biosynthesis protein TsaE
LLAASLDERGAVIALIGELGAGKTLFVKGLAEGLGIEPERVTSPTYVIASEYPVQGGRKLAHVDLYRIKSADELEGTGFADLLGPGVILAIEWGDRFPEALPADRLEVTLEHVEDDEGVRILSAAAHGAVSKAVLEAWRKGLGEDADPYGLEGITHG